MSYAGPASRSNRTSHATPAPASAGAGRNPAGGPSPTPGAPHETDWQQVAIFGAGLALGIALGAGVAMLTAPASGIETRYALAKRARRVRRASVEKGHDAWDGLRREIRNAARALERRKMRRELKSEIEAGY